MTEYGKLAVVQCYFMGTQNCGKVVTLTTPCLKKKQTSVLLSFRYVHETIW